MSQTNGLQFAYMANGAWAPVSSEKLSAYTKFVAEKVIPKIETRMQEKDEGAHRAANVFIRPTKVLVKSPA